MPQTLICMSASPPQHSHSSYPFWLPDLNRDWESRYQPALNQMRAAGYEKLTLESRYRRWQQRFESGLVPQIDTPQPPIPPAGTGHTDASLGTAPIEVDGAELNLASFGWSQLQESNLGMAGLAKWVDAEALYQQQGSKEHDTMPLALLLAALETDPNLVTAKNKADFWFAQADMFLSQLIKQQPRDVLAWTYRGELRKGWAELIKLGLLPLVEQPLPCPQASQYRKLVDSAVVDLTQAIRLWVQSFADPETPEPEDGQHRYSRPRGSAAQRALIIHHLHACYLMRYALYKADRKREAAVADLTGALSLKPRISLFLARAEQFQRLGLFQSAAADYLESLVRVTEHIPNSQRSTFERNLQLLRVEMSVGNVGAVIRHACRFWQVNPMLMLV